MSAGRPDSHAAPAFPSCAAFSRTTGGSTTSGFAMTRDPSSCRLESGTGPLSTHGFRSSSLLDSQPFCGAGRRPVALKYRPSHTDGTGRPWSSVTAHSDHKVQQVHVELST